jgi:PAS domain-containing protein
MPEQAGRQGQDLAQPGSFFTRHRDSGQQETLLTGIAYVTGNEHMMAQRTVKPADLLMDKTLLVSVSRHLPTIFADWRKDAYEKAALFGLLALIASVGLFLNQRRQRAYARVVASGEVERQLAAQALQGTQDLLARAEELGRVGGWEFDVETGQQTWTKAVYDIHELDFTLHPTVSQSINFYTPDSRPIIEQAVQRALEQGEPFDLELEIVTAKGNLRYVHAVGRTDLARRKVSGFIQDITERKQAEARSYESENRRISEQAAALEAERRAGLAALHLMEDAVSARTRAETMTATLSKQLDELHRWQQLTLGREGRILAMKQEVNSLLAESGQQARYASAADAETPK